MNRKTMILCVGLLAAVSGLSLTARHWRRSPTSQPGPSRETTTQQSVYSYSSDDIQKHQQDYLCRLRDTNLGVETIQHQNPEIVFYGDSHTQSGWDYHMLQRGLTPKVGCFAISGNFPEALIDFLDSVRENKLSVRYVVLCIWPQMFWNLEERFDRVTSVRQAIAMITPPPENVVKVKSGPGTYAPFIGYREGYSRRRDALAQQLSTISEERVTHFLDKHGNEFHGIQYWTKQTKKGQLHAEMPRIIETIARKLQATRIELAVLYMPESRWMNDQYSAQQRDQFLEVAQMFGKIAGLYNVDFFHRGGMDNRYFLNRYMREDYPYEAWRKSTPEEAKKWIQEEDEPHRRWEFFDADHLNVVGAEEYTQAMLPLLQRWTKSTKQSTER